jgi:hypothetical protein
MNKIFLILKKLNILPYLVIIILTLIVGWFLFRHTVPNEVISEINDISVTKIQAVGKMELVKMTIKDVLEYTIKRDYLPDSRILLVVSGEIAGCIDLTKLETKNIISNDSILEITLPNPEICYYKIDHQKSKIYNATTYYMLDDEAKLTQLVYQKAENYFKSDSLNRIVFKETELNAQKVLKPILESITHKKVKLSFNKKSIKN